MQMNDIRAPRRRHSGSILGLSVFVFGFSLASAQIKNDPDPTALLRGVESARLRIPPSTLKLRYICREFLGTNTTEMVVDFDGELRGFACEVLGQGKETYRTVFDGSRATVYSSLPSRFELRDIGNANHMKLFDPRLLGLSPYYQWTETPESTIWYKHVDKVELVGKEQVGEQAAWHIRATKNLPLGPFATDYWIDDKNGFRVYRRDINGVQIFSYYGNPDYPWLPSQVVAKDFASAHANTIKGETEVQVLDARANVVFPESRWTMAGMGITGNAEVVDNSLMRRIGDWNGSAYIPAVPDIPAPEKRHIGIGNSIVIGVMAVSLVVLFLLLKRRKSAS